MLCDFCREKPASIHMTKVINNKKTELNLCPECAAKQGALHFNLIPELVVPNFLAGLFANGGNIQPVTAQNNEEKCPNCGVNYQQFTRNGLMGCNKCYDTFSRQTDPLLRRIHGSVRHGGKVPQRGGSHLKLKIELKYLRDQLQQAVQREEFEKAAELRDKINELEKQ